MDTYDHRPFYLIARERGQICAGWPLMEASSPFTGRKGVALPFSDNCVPLLNASNILGSLAGKMIELGKARNWKFLEFRNSAAPAQSASPSVEFYSHELNLRPEMGALESGLDGSIRRGIKKALKSGAVSTIENTSDSMRSYFKLHCLTRRRHGLAPQPWRFFFNLWRLVVENGKGFVVLARYQGRVIAGAVFLVQASNAIYKFGASDERYQHMRPNNLVMWSAINHIKEAGLSALSFGRTSLTNDGLRKFKLNWGCREEVHKYFRYSLESNSFVSAPDRVEGWYNTLFRKLPLFASKMIGNAVYPHLI